MLGFEREPAPELVDTADDHVIFERTKSGFTHVATGIPLAAHADGHLSRAGSPIADGAPFTACHGPERLPSEYLTFFREQGWVCLTSVLPPTTLDGLRQVACTDAYAKGRYNRADPAISQHPAVACTAAEPISLWLIRQYMQTDDIRLAHTPAMAVLGQDDGERVVQGWHSDYPYHWGVPAQGRVPSATGATVLGVQRNVCVSDFTQIGGATAFKLGSHARDEPPPAAWGLACDHIKPGYRAAHGLPYNGPDADIIEAPGGSIILYDARTWHRAGVNRTPHKRAAMLQAMVPMYVMPKSDTSAAYKHFMASAAREQLNDREQREIQNLMVHYFIGPGGQDVISPDAELTAQIGH